MIKVGVVGLGRMGLTHAENIHKNVPGAQLIALCSHDNKADELAKSWGVKYSYNSYEKMIANEEIDAVIIVTLTKDHPKHILMALKAGKHVFCEKPLGATSNDALELVNEANKFNKQVIQIGFMRRFDKNYQEAKKMIDNKIIGKPFMIDSLSEDNVADIENMFSYGPVSGGAFIDVSAHDLDLMIWMFNSYPVRSFALGQPYKYQEFRNWKDGDFVAAMVEFSGGEIGVLKASRLGTQGYQAKMEISGTEGHLNVNLVASKTNVSSITKNGFGYDYHRNFNDFFADSYVNELKDFIKSIEDRNYSRDSLNSALVNILAIKQIQESFDNKQALNIEYPFDVKELMNGS